jgi:hypothetical protein
MASKLLKIKFEISHSVFIHIKKEDIALLEGRTPNLETHREPPENGTRETSAFVRERSD